MRDTPAMDLPDAEARGGRPRLAIVSTYDELCGIAGYTRALVRQLEGHLAVTVFDLDQYLLRSPHRRVQNMGDKHIRDIAAQLAAFDSVNIQLEYGTLGTLPGRILKRLQWLMDAAPSLSITFHTVLTDQGLPFAQLARSLRGARLVEAGAAIVEYACTAILRAGVYSSIRRLQGRKRVSCIVHTRRDARLLRDVYRIENVFDHPLVFVEPHRAATVRAATSRQDFPLLESLPPDAKLIGSFGFLSRYKGFDTAIAALRLLPANHHLLIFGGIHPQTIKLNQPLDPYLATLLHEARIGETLFDTLKGSGVQTSLQLDAESRDLLLRHPQDLSDRVHFMGVLNDDAFMGAMAICDAVVVPYLEVGQSSSGPISIALDMGSRVIASRTRAFLQFARYHEDQVEFFDIGNFVELAGRLRASPPNDPRLRKPKFNSDTNAAVYLSANFPALAPKA